MTALPTDLEIQRNLVPVRAAVLDATRRVRSPKHSSRYRTLRNLIIAAAAIAVLTAGTIVAVRASQYYINHTPSCYQHRSLDSLVVTGTFAGATEDEAPNPIEYCQAVWRNDLFTPHGYDPTPDDGTSPVPELIWCELPDGSPGIFPREDGPADDADFCEALGLAQGGFD